MIQAADVIWNNPAKTFPSSFNTWPCRTFQRPAGKKGKTSATRLEAKKCTVSLHAADASKKVGRLLMHEFFIWLLHTRGSWICSDCIHQTIASLMYSALHVIHINVHFLLVTSHDSHVIISTVTFPLAPTENNVQTADLVRLLLLPGTNVEMAKFPSTFTLHPVLKKIIPSQIAKIQILSEASAK